MSEKKNQWLDNDVEVTTANAYDNGVHDIDPALIPTEEELRTLRKVAAPLPWVALAMCTVEFAERASYYGCSAVFGNFVRNSFPVGGNGHGAVAHGPAGVNQKAGALGKGLVASNAITNTFTFLAYVTPIFGGILADVKLGRYRAIWIGTLIGFFAHVLLVVPAIPGVIDHPNGSLGVFIVAMLILAFAAGFIKPSLAPLLCDQSPVKHATIKVLKSGERVILDPSTTLSRWLVLFYLSVNIGGFFAIATSYSARNVGFWLAFFVPGLVYLLLPIVLYFIGPKLYKAPPGGSVVLDAFHVIKVLLGKGGWGRLFKKNSGFWDYAKPTYLHQHGGDTSRIFWDDTLVDEVRQTIQACGVFLLVPLFNLANGGWGDSMGAMSNAMTLNSVPNDLLQRFNPLAIIIFSPIITYGLYPLFQRLGYPIMPMTRMSIGFLTGTIGSVIAAVVQWRIYQTSPCGYYASTCDSPSPINLWLQFPIVVIPAIGELFVNVTAYEVAYTNAPARMKSFVMSLFLFATAISSALSLALSNVIVDPDLMWPHVASAVSTFLAAFLFPTYFRHLNHPPESFADEGRMAGKIDRADSVSEGEVAIDTPPTLQNPAYTQTANEKAEERPTHRV